MSATGSSGEDSSIPAEVPEEFADAYRAAFEEALRAQPVGPPGAHADRSTTRRRPVDTVRPTPPTQVETEPTAYERVRDSGWFVPLLLLVLFLILLAGAYLLGRQFSAHVGPGDHAAGPRPPGVISPV